MFVVFFPHSSPDNSAMKNQKYTQIPEQLKPNIVKGENVFSRQNKTYLVKELNLVKKPKSVINERTPPLDAEQVVVPAVVL